MSRKLALGLLTLAMGSAQIASAQNWNETTNGGGDAGIHNVAQAAALAGPLTSITGGLNQTGGDHVDCYQITVTDAATFYATTDPGVDPLAVIGETDTRLWLWNATGSTIISGNDDTPSSPGLLSYIANVGDPRFVAVPTNPVTTMLVDGMQYVLCYSYFPNDPDDAGGVDLVNLGTFEALNGPNPAAGAFAAYENTGTDAAAAYTIALRGASGTMVGMVSDLSITKTNGGTASVPGTNTTYTIVASNAGPSTATGAVVADTFPAACTTVSTTCAGAGGGTCTAGPTAGNISDLVNLPSGGSVTYTSVCSISGSATGNLNNTATVTEPMGTVDPNPANNSATDSDTMGAMADVGITKTATTVPNPVVVGSTIVYTLTANNAGPSDATGVVVSDSLPANLTYVSNDCGAVFAAPTMTWTIGNLANGASPACNLTTTVNDFGPISNTATIASTSGDPNGANASSTAALGGVPFPADVAIALTSNAPTSLGVGSQFAYTVTGTNNGPGVANGLTFSLTLSNKVSFVSSTCGAVLNGNVVSWTVPTLAIGATTSCAITVAVVAAGELLASASVVTQTVDPVVANNAAQLVVGFIATAVPTLGQLGLLLLALVVLGGGVLVIRR